MVPTLCIPHDEASKRSSAIWNVISHMLAPFVKSLFSKILLCHFRSKYFLLRTGFMFTTPHLENNLCFLFWSQNMRLKKKLLCWRKKNHSYFIHIYGCGGYFTCIWKMWKTKVWQFFSGWVFHMIWRIWGDLLRAGLICLISFPIPTLWQSPHNSTFPTQLMQ